MIQDYYAECRNGEIIQREFGFIAVSRLRSSTQTIEHIWVHPDFRDTDSESKLLKLAYDNAVENSRRYVEIEVALNSPTLMEQHRLLVGLGYAPAGSTSNTMTYERRTHTA